MKKILTKRKNLIEAFITFMIITVIYGYMTHKMGFNILLTGIAGVFLLCAVIKFLDEKLFDKILDKFLKYRWLIYLILFIIGVVFKLHGSSIGVYNYYFKEKIDYNKVSLIMGKPRLIRSDEFIVQTPYYFSQDYNDYNKNSSQMSITPQNMIIGYNSPVKDITVLAKPLNWGYLLFGKDYGLSWYWCMKALLLFALALECMLIITKNKKLSIAGALLVSLGPSTQWWFVPHMPDVILWMMAIISSVYYYLSTDKRWLKNTLMIMIPFIASEFVIALFPSFQVGLGIFALVMLILLIIRDKLSLLKDKKQNIRHIIVIILTLSLLGYFVLTNKEALLAVMNTAYPGKRVNLGGNLPFSAIFTDLTTMFLPYYENLSYSNYCEISTYIHFGFFITLLFPVLYIQMKKKKDKNLIMGIGMLSVLFVYSFFMIIGFPEWLAKLTFFSYINRMKMIVGLISIFYTVWGMDSIIKYRDKINPIYYTVCAIIFCGIQVFFINTNIRNYIGAKLCLAELIIFFIIIMSLYIKYDRTSISCLLGMLLFSGLLINPVVTGTSDIYNHPSAMKIQEIVKEDKDARWISYNNLFSSSYILLNGGKNIFGVNFYPDKEKWDILHPKKEEELIYNRYAHFNVSFTESEEENYSIDCPFLDQVTIKLNLQNLVDLNVKYILSLEELNRENEEYKLSEIYKDSDCYIYKIINKNI